MNSDIVFMLVLIVRQCRYESNNIFERNQYSEMLKVISTSGYFLFLAISTPMCIASLYKLRQFQRFNASSFSFVFLLVCHCSPI